MVTSIVNKRFRPNWLQLIIVYMITWSYLGCVEFDHGQICVLSKLVDYPGYHIEMISRMLVPDLMAVAWLLAWARVLACVTRWPPGCTLPTLPPLRLSHYYHICSTHPCLLISNPQLYHICQEMFHHFSLLLSQWEPLPSVLDFCNNLCCLHFVNIWNETGSIRTETLL